MLYTLGLYVFVGFIMGLLSVFSVKRDLHAIQKAALVTIMTFSWPLVAIAGVALLIEQKFDEKPK